MNILEREMEGERKRERERERERGSVAGGCLTPKEVSLMTCSSISCVSWREAKPMLMAVSCLSPVNTHTFIPACLRVAMLSGTPYKLSGGMNLHVREDE